MAFILSATEVVLVMIEIDRHPGVFDYCEVRNGYDGIHYDVTKLRASMSCSVGEYYSHDDEGVEAKCEAEYESTEAVWNVLRAKVEFISRDAIAVASAKCRDILYTVRTRH